MVTLWVGERPGEPTFGGWAMSDESPSALRSSRSASTAMKHGVSVQRLDPNDALYHEGWMGKQGWFGVSVRLIEWFRLVPLFWVAP